MTLKEYKEALAAEREWRRNAKPISYITRQHDYVADLTIAALSIAFVAVVYLVNV